MQSNSEPFEPLYPIPPDCPIPFPTSSSSWHNPRQPSRQTLYDPADYLYPPPVLYGPVPGAAYLPSKPLYRTAPSHPGQTFSSPRSPRSAVSATFARQGQQQGPNQGASEPDEDVPIAQLDALQVGTEATHPLGERRLADPRREGEQGEEGDAGGEMQVEDGQANEAAEDDGEAGEGDSDEWDSDSDEGEHEMRVEDEGDEGNLAPTAYRPFTFERSSVKATGGFTLDVAVGPRIGPLTADQLPPNANGKDGTVQYVLGLLKPNRDQHAYNDLPLPTLRNARLYKPVASTLPLSWLSSIKIQPPAATALNNDLARGLLSFLAFFTYSLSAYATTEEDGEAWIAHLERPEVQKRASELGLGLYLLEHLRGLARLRAQGGWEGTLKRLFEYIGWSDGWDRFIAGKKRKLRPLAHITGPQAKKPKTLVKFIFQELQVFQKENPQRRIQTFLSLGGSAAPLDRSVVSYKRVKDVESFGIVSRYSALTYGGLNVISGGGANRHLVVYNTLRTKPALSSLRLRDDGSSALPGASPSQVIVAAQAVEHKRLKGVADPLSEACVEAEQNCSGEKGEKERRANKVRESGIQGERFKKDGENEGEDDRLDEEGGRKSGSVTIVGPGECVDDEDDEAGVKDVRADGSSRMGAPFKESHVNFSRLNKANQDLVKPFASYPGFSRLCGEVHHRLKKIYPTILTPASARQGVTVRVCHSTKKTTSSSINLVFFGGDNLTTRGQFSKRVPAEYDTVQMRWDAVAREFEFLDEDGDAVVCHAVSSGREQSWTWSLADLLSAMAPLSVNRRRGEELAEAEVRTKARETERTRIIEEFFE